MTNIQDVRKQLEASFGNMNTARAQEMAKGMLDRDTAKGQVTKLTADLVEWSQRNKARITSMIRDEVRDQLRLMGVATEQDLNALRKRVRDLERANRASGSRASAKRSSAKASSAKRSTTTKAASASKRSSATKE
jgi:polyhydroxyalkanoate synthesis regulator phasin